MTIVLVTGGFDPLHSGHIEYFRAARELGDLLVVGVNSDQWLTRKKGRPFIPLSERKIIIENLYKVHKVIEFDDLDNSAIDAIRRVKAMFPRDRIVFANGGDRTKDNIPEMVFDDVEFVFGVGGHNKMNSSSWILEEWAAPKTVRPWGYYRVIHSPSKTVKVKELTVDPGKYLSVQRHQHRSEFWFVSCGVATVRVQDTEVQLQEHQSIEIKFDQWHQLINNTEKPLRIIEIQYGVECVEQDIERK